MQCTSLCPRSHNVSCCLMTLYLRQPGWASTRTLCDNPSGPGPELSQTTWVGRHQNSRRQPGWAGTRTLRDNLGGPAPELSETTRVGRHQNSLRQPGWAGTRTLGDNPGGPAPELSEILTQYATFTVLRSSQVLPTFPPSLSLGCNTNQWKQLKER